MGIDIEILDVMPPGDLAKARTFDNCIARHINKDACVCVYPLNCMHKSEKVDFKKHLEGRRCARAWKLSEARVTAQ